MPHVWNSQAALWSPRQNKERPPEVRTGPTLRTPDCLRRTAASGDLPRQATCRQRCPQGHGTLHSLIQPAAGSTVPCSISGASPTNTGHGRECSLHTVRSAHTTGNYSKCFASSASGAQFMAAAALCGNVRHPAIVGCATVASRDRMLARSPSTLWTLP